MNLSAIVQVNGSPSTAAGQSRSQRGQTPDWIRDIFHHAKRGHREKLVSRPPPFQSLPNYLKYRVRK